MTRLGIIYLDENYAEFGIIQSDENNIKIDFEGKVVIGKSYEDLKKFLKFDYKTGHYIIGKRDKNKGNFSCGRESFPYTLSSTIYNAKFEEHLFRNKQILSESIQFKYINELPYSFGLEFETAGGCLPQHQLFELGLIPLRDGSIRGIEFTTIVLQGNQGLNLLKRQIDALKGTTIFDKDCSLHIHLGGFQLSPEVLLLVNNAFVNSDIKQYLPLFTFDTTRYKSNRDKNYCAFNSRYSSFDTMYGLLVEKPYFGDLKQPHPRDLTATRKWNIGSRYRAINFINAICYDNPKTIEFRFLRPTYNFEKILCWLFIFGAFIKFAERRANSTNLYSTKITLVNMLHDVYSNELAEILIEFLECCKNIKIAQEQYEDYWGQRSDLDDQLINYQSIGRKLY